MKKGRVKVKKFNLNYQRKDKVLKEIINILHLEDDNLDAELIKVKLNQEELKYNIISAKNKEDFINALNNEKIDIILADYNLPTINGIDALKISQKIKPEIPFLFVSGAIGEELAIESLKAGATDYVLKNQLQRLYPSIQRALKEYEEIAMRKEAEEEVKQGYNRLLKTFDQIVLAFSSLSEKRDPYIAGHQSNVAKISCEIARELGINEYKIKGIQIAGNLHDIGKIYVPAEILNKPGKLNEYEFNIIKTHPQVGYDILKEIDFPWPVALAVLQHHEKINGSGYPQGLLGSQIIIEAKIISVADVIEAMVSHRPYRSQSDIETALEGIQNNKGILFDAQIVDICIDLFKKKNFKFDEF